MGAKDISKTMSLKDGVSGTLQKISRGTVQYKKQLKDLKDQGNNTWNSMRDGIGALAGIAAGYLSIGAAVSFLSGAAEEARLATEADTKLVAVLKNVKGVTDAQVQSLKDYAQELENVGVVGGDVVTAGIQQAGTFQLQAQTLKTLMPGMADLLAQQKGLNASQGDAVSIGNLIGKAMTGQVGALSKVGISFTEQQKKVLQFGTEQQRAATLAKVLQENVGGVNKALAETDMGKITQASNAWGAMKETIGGAVLTFQAELANSFMTKLPQIQVGIQAIADGIQNWVENGGVERMINGLQNIWDHVVGVYSFIKNNWSTISPIIYGIAGAFALLKLVQMGVAAWQTIMIARQWGLNAAMSANPVGIIVVGIGALIALGTLLIQNWEQVKLTGMKTWNVIVSAAEWAVNKYIEFANFMSRVYKFAWDSIEYAGVSIWNGILSAAEAGANGFIGLINSMIEQALDGINSLISGANKVSEALGMGKVVSELSFGGLGKVDFSGAKGEAVKPKWDSGLSLLPSVNFSRAQFSEDSLMSQTQKAQQERDKKKSKSEEALTQALAANTSALSDNTSATGANTSATGANTSATGANTATLKGNQSATDLADSLLGRIERHLYGT